MTGAAGGSEAGLSEEEAAAIVVGHAMSGNGSSNSTSLLFRQTNSGEGVLQGWKDN